MADSSCEVKYSAGLRTALSSGQLDICNENTRQYAINIIVALSFTLALDGIEGPPHVWKWSFFGDNLDGTVDLLQKDNYAI